MTNSKLKVSNLSYFNDLNDVTKTEDSFSDLCGNLSSLDYEFEFGRLYLLNSIMGGWGQTVSYIISGMLKSYDGVILRDGVFLSTKMRKKFVCPVRRNSGKRFLWWEQTVEDQVLEGLKKDRGQFWKDSEEIRIKLGIDSARFKRPLRTLSFQGWKASCAIGLSWAQDIFCFPHMPTSYMEIYQEPLAQLLETLTDTHALVLLPAILNELSANLTDVVVEHQ